LQQIFFLKNQNRFILPAIGWLIFTTILLTLPVSAFPKDRWIIKIPMLDKWIHIGLFSIMAVLFCWGYYKMKFSGKLKNNFISIGIYCLAYGIVMEFVQKYFVPNRSFDMGDIVADGAGAAIGVVYSIRRYIKK
jgi:VanZ family protein